MLFVSVAHFLSGLLDLRFFFTLRIPASKSVAPSSEFATLSS